MTTREPVWDRLLATAECKSLLRVGCRPDLPDRERTFLCYQYVMINPTIATTAWANLGPLASLVVLTAGTQVSAAPQAKTEACGWLLFQGAVLVEQADPNLRPSDPRPLAAPPTQAKAAYCVRDTMMTYVGDERVLKLGLPLVIRSGDREGVLEANPTVLFNFHKVGTKYLPGKADTGM